jgi:anthranilate synthase component 1
MHFPITTKVLHPEHCDPLVLYKALGKSETHIALLESAVRQGTNDYSFLALGAHDRITVSSGNVKGSRFVPDGPVKDPLVPFENIIEPHQSSSRLTMGYIGFVSYEAARQFEAIDLAPDPRIPDAVFFLPEVLLRIDHSKHEVTLTYHDGTTRDIAAIERTIMASPYFDDRKEKEIPGEGTLPLPTLEEIEPYRQTSRASFCTAIREIQEKILAGEAFQVVLSQELKVPATVSPEAVYGALRSLNPSPYMYIMRLPEATIVGASPETLVRVEGRNILYRPIAGTRKRTGDPAADVAMQKELMHDEKERCEHQMLVDLGRNDVGRVAEIGSVRVTNPFHIEQYAHVFHIVSDVTGTLRSDLTSLDALRSVFPAGTLTGAPKVRAMEIIRELEGGPRGIYGGALGYIDLAGNIDMAITIRTMLFQDGHISLRAGAGIVKDSVPEHEDNECLFKARSCFAAIRQAASSPTRS